MLKKINFFERLKEINEKRVEMFKNEYANEKFLFKDPKEMHLNPYTNEFICNAPACEVYDLLLNPNREIESMGQSKGFFESFSINRGDLDIVCTKPDPMPEIPLFYKDIDYGSYLFSELKEEELENFLNGIESWPKTTNFEVSFVHPLGKSLIGYDRITMKNVYYTHFISPTYFNVDYLSYGSNFPFADTL